MTRPRQSREAKRAATRSAIVDSASAAIAARGYHAASVDSIAQDAGFTVGALYSNFGKKEDLLAEAVTRYHDDIAALIAEALGSATTLEDQVVNVARAWMDEVTQRPERLLLWIELWASAQRLGAPLKTITAQQTRSLRGTLAGMLSAAAAAESAPLSPQAADKLAAVLDALGVGLAMNHLLDPEGTPRAMIDDIAAGILPMVVPRQETADESSE